MASRKEILEIEVILFGLKSCCFVESFLVSIQRKKNWTVGCDASSGYFLHLFSWCHRVWSESKERRRRTPSRSLFVRRKRVGKEGSSFDKKKHRQKEKEDENTGHTHKRKRRGNKFLSLQTRLFSYPPHSYVWGIVIRHKTVFAEPPQLLRRLLFVLVIICTKNSSKSYEEIDMELLLSCHHHRHHHQRNHSWERERETWKAILTDFGLEWTGMEWTRKRDKMDSIESVDETHLENNEQAFLLSRRSIVELLSVLSLKENSCSFVVVSLPLSGHCLEAWNAK